MNRTNLIPALLGAFLTLVIVGGKGCMTFEQAQATRDTVAVGVEHGDALAASLAEERDAALARAEAAEQAADAARAEAERATAAKIQTAIDKVDEYLAPARENLVAWDKALANWDEASSGAGLVGEIGETVLPFLPLSWQAPGVMVLGIGGVLARLIQKSNGLNSLARSTVKLADEHPEVAEAIKASSSLLDKIQNRAAKAAIDAAQGKKAALPV